MKKNIILPNLLQKIISEEELSLISEAFGYKDTARKLTVLTLVQYLLCAAVDELKGYRPCADVGTQYGLPKVDHSSLSKKSKHIDYQILIKLFDLVVSKCNRATKRSLQTDKIRHLLIVDSTTITVGETRLPWAAYHGKRAGVKLHVSYTPETEMPLKVTESIARKHDGPVGEQLVDNRFVIVEDRAYLKIQRIDQFAAEKQHYVIRMKDNITLVQPRPLKRIVPTDSPVTRDITCELGTEKSRSETRHRVVFFTDDKGREIRVVTNLKDVTPEVIADMYKARWKIESFFRWIKQNLNISTLFGTSENAVFNQLFAGLIAYVLLRWLYIATSEGRVFKKMSPTAFQRQLLANTLSMDWHTEMLLFLSRICPDGG